MDAETSRHEPCALLPTAEAPPLRRSDRPEAAALLGRADQARPAFGGPRCDGTPSRGPGRDGLNHAALDAALTRLGGKTTVHQRLAILRQLAEYWHGPLG